jgi:hypothetical protein
MLPGAILLSSSSTLAAASIVSGRHLGDIPPCRPSTSNSERHNTRQIRERVITKHPNRARDLRDRPAWPTNCGVTTGKSGAVQDSMPARVSLTDPDTRDDACGARQANRCGETRHVRISSFHPPTKYVGKSHPRRLRQHGA